MLKYLLKRMIATIITIFIVIAITFFLMHAIPGGPFNLMNPKMTPGMIEAMNTRYHLDEPVFIQFFNYLKTLMQGDLGPSYQKLGVPVNVILMQAFPVSAKVGTVAIVVVVFVGMGLGICSALRKDRGIDKGITFLTTLGVSVPNFVIASMVLYFFSERIGILPSNGLYSWKHYIGPVISLSIFSISFLTRLMATTLDNVLNQDYIRTCRANGLPEYRVIFFHGVRNAMLPILAYLGPTVASILTGSFVTEKVFTIPGMGGLFINSINNRDYMVIMGTTLFYSVLVVGIIFLIDVVYMFIDPRIKLEK